MYYFDRLIFFRYRKIRCRLCGHLVLVVPEDKYCPFCHRKNFK